MLLHDTADPVQVHLLQTEVRAGHADAGDRVLPPVEDRASYSEDLGRFLAHVQGVALGIDFLDLQLTNSSFTLSL
jgi:hypothetical protein